VLEPGAIVAGKFRIERILGAGGMGVVVVGTHLQLDQRVALKVLHDKAASDRATVERFLREARAVAKLKSEHICRVSDVGQLDDGAPYIVMELLEGRDLARVIADRPLAPAIAVDYVVQACVAIAEAHAWGIVHRDLKPANLFVTRRLDGSPLVKVLDFGIAKAPAGADTALTGTNTVMGTPGYMAPEQLRSTRDVDVRADIWALGVILYQSISGRLPFSAASLTEFAVKIAMDPPDPIEVDAALRKVVLRCLEKEPEQRYRDISALAQALAPFGGPSSPANAALAAKLLSSRSGSADTLPSVEKVGTVATTLQGAAGAPANVSTPQSRKPWWIAGAVAACAAIAGGAVLATSYGEQPDRPRANLALVAPAPPPPLTALPDAAIPDAAIIAVAPPVSHPAVRRSEPRTPTAPLKPAPVPAAVPATITLAEAHARARSASLDADWELELKYLQIVLAATPDDPGALSAATMAECYLRDTPKARAYARRLPHDRRADVAKLCSSYDVVIDEPSLADKEREFAAAIATHHCARALVLERDLAIVGPQYGQEVAECERARARALADLDKPDSEPWVVAQAEDLVAAGKSAVAQLQLDAYYYGRTVYACKEHDAASARTSYRKVKSDEYLKLAIKTCTALQITLE
jgi:tRNA A-37 threonylcarbamoyl transferase component Bud32